MTFTLLRRTIVACGALALLSTAAQPPSLSGSA